VFIASMLLVWKTRLLREEIVDRLAVTQKLIAAGMVVGGLVLIAIACNHPPKPDTFGGKLTATFG